MTVPPGPRVNIGSGPHNPPGWINIDGSMRARIANWKQRLQFGESTGNSGATGWPAGILHRNLTRGIGFRDSSVAVVYSSHTLEHLFRSDAVRVLRDVHRSLMSGGVCRVVVPDVASIVDWYLQNRSTDRSTRKLASSDLLMHLLLLRPPAPPEGVKPVDVYRRLTNFDHHKWMYDSEGLIALFQEAGFGDPHERDYLDSEIPLAELSLVEHASRITNGAGVCVEARK